MQYSQTGERFFCQSKPKFRRTAYTSVKDFMTNEGKQIEPVLGSEFLEVSLIKIEYNFSVIKLKRRIEFLSVF